MDVIYEGAPPQITVFTGPLADQSALHGVLARVHDLDLPLLSVARIGIGGDGAGITPAQIAQPLRALYTPRLAQTGSNGRLIELRDLVKIYRTPAGDFPALRSINLSVSRGEFVAVVGKSGSGKTTMINMLTGIDRPTSGAVLVDEIDIHALNESKMSSWRGRNLGVVFQFFQLLPTLTLIENVTLPMDLCGAYPLRERRARALRLLELVDIAENADKLPSEISGGQQQRAAIARALANDPPIIAADEPTGNLDFRTADAIIALFQNLVDQGKTILMVTHDNDLASRASRIVELADGEIIRS
ncbi:MAG: ABC transporter ATP-binding protein [Anaerolineae bacterium]|nr:ABC transporter ATP-binding protein [Anaerolineae bacterium]